MEQNCSWNDYNRRDRISGNLKMDSRRIKLQPYPHHRMVASPLGGHGSSYCWDGNRSQVIPYQNQGQSQNNNYYYVYQEDVPELEPEEIITISRPYEGGQEKEILKPLLVRSEYVSPVDDLSEELQLQIKNQLSVLNTMSIESVCSSSAQRGPFQSISSTSSGQNLNDHQEQLQPQPSSFTFTDSNGDPMTQDSLAYFSRLRVVYATAIVAANSAPKLLENGGVGSSKSLLLYSEVGALTPPNELGKIKLVTVRSSPNQLLSAGKHQILKLSMPTAEHIFDVNSPEACEFLSQSPTLFPVQHSDPMISLIPIHLQQDTVRQFTAKSTFASSPLSPFADYSDPKFSCQVVTNLRDTVVCQQLLSASSRSRQDPDSGWDSTSDSMSVITSQNNDQAQQDPAKTRDNVNIRQQQMQSQTSLVLTNTLNSTSNRISRNNKNEEERSRSLSASSKEVPGGSKSDPKSESSSSSQSHTQIQAEVNPQPVNSDILNPNKLSAKNGGALKLQEVKPPTKQPKLTKVSKSNATNEISSKDSNKRIQTSQNRWKAKTVVANLPTSSTDNFNFENGIENNIFKSSFLSTQSSTSTSDTKSFQKEITKIKRTNRLKSSAVANSDAPKILNSNSRTTVSCTNSTISSEVIDEEAIIQQQQLSPKHRRKPLVKKTAEKANRFANEVILATKSKSGSKTNRRKTSREKYPTSADSISNPTMKTRAKPNDAETDIKFEPESQSAVQRDDPANNTKRFIKSQTKLKTETPMKPYVSKSPRGTRTKLKSSVDSDVDDTDSEKLARHPLVLLTADADSDVGSGVRPEDTSFPSLDNSGTGAKSSKSKSKSVVKISNMLPLSISLSCSPCFPSNEKLEGSELSRDVSLNSNSNWSVSPNTVVATATLVEIQLQPTAERSQDNVTMSDAYVLTVDNATATVALPLDLHHPDQSVVPLPLPLPLPSASTTSNFKMDEKENNCSAQNRNQTILEIRREEVLPTPTCAIEKNTEVAANAAQDRSGFRICHLNLANSGLLVLADVATMSYRQQFGHTSASAFSASDSDRHDCLPTQENRDQVDQCKANAQQLFNKVSCDTFTNIKPNQRNINRPRSRTHRSISPPSSGASSSSIVAFKKPPKRMKLTDHDPYRRPSQHRLH